MSDDVTRALAQSSKGIELARTVGAPMDLNRDHWDEATAIHARGNVYGIEDFKAGRCQLHRIEVEELGDVAGKTLLHLQCHFGLGTLSWARRGAVVTGVDFSPKAIALARSLADGVSVMVVPDGPRGPREIVKPGVITLAALSGAAIVPVALGASSEWRLRSWDGFRIPRPFARCVVRFAEPIAVARGADRDAREAARKAVEAALHSVSGRADAEAAA
jgi:SAM-dependent methyltransferase